MYRKKLRDGRTRSSESVSEPKTPIFSLKFDMLRRILLPVQILRRILEKQASRILEERFRHMGNNMKYLLRKFLAQGNSRKT